MSTAGPDREQLLGLARAGSSHALGQLLEMYRSYYPGTKEAHTSLRRQRRRTVPLRWRLRLVCESYLPR